MPTQLDPGIPLRAVERKEVAATHVPATRGMENGCSGSFSTDQRSNHTRLAKNSSSVLPNRETGSVLSEEDLDLLQKKWLQIQQIKYSTA